MKKSERWALLPLAVISTSRTGRQSPRTSNSRNTALAGVGWTLSASELWVAAQRAMPSGARGRMNAAVMMISQGAMVLGGTIWGSAAAIAGPACALLGASFLFLLRLLLDGRLSIIYTRCLRGGL